MSGRQLAQRIVLKIVITRAAAQTKAVLKIPVPPKRRPENGNQKNNGDNPKPE
jgi:hypothetical protein